MAILQNTKSLLTAFVFAFHLAGYVAALPQMDVEQGVVPTTVASVTATATTPNS